jgi:hypothetical protein
LPECRIPTQNPTRQKKRIKEGFFSVELQDAGVHNAGIIKIVVKVQADNIVVFVCCKFRNVCLTVASCCQVELIGLLGNSCQFFVFPGARNWN